MDELAEYFQMLLDYAQTGAQNLNPESQRALAQFIQQFIEFMQEYQARLESTPISEAPQMTEAMPSSNVEGFAYDDNSNRLYVRFLGKHPNRFGPVYQYENVPPNIFEIFRKGAIPAKTDGKNKWGRWWRGKFPSIGASMYHMIRAGGYPYQQVG
jgi:hypothetical protein